MNDMICTDLLYATIRKRHETEVTREVRMVKVADRHTIFHIDSDTCSCRYLRGEPRTSRCYAEENKHDRGGNRIVAGQGVAKQFLPQMNCTSSSH